MRLLHDAEHYVIMENLVNVLEGVLGNDLEDTIETSVHDNRINKLIDKWMAKRYDGGAGKDFFGNELNVGDWVMIATGSGGIDFGRIIRTDWSAVQELTIVYGSDTHEDKITAGNVIKLEPKQAYNILKSLCGH